MIENSTFYLEGVEMGMESEGWEFFDEGMLDGGNLPMWWLDLEPSGYAVTIGFDGDYCVEVYAEDGSSGFEYHFCRSLHDALCKAEEMMNTYSYVDGGSEWYDYCGRC